MGDSDLIIFFWCLQPNLLDLLTVSQRDALDEPPDIKLAGIRIDSYGETSHNSGAYR